jgi:hypothetical protein
VASAALAAHALTEQSHPTCPGCHRLDAGIDLGESERGTLRDLISQMPSTRACIDNGVTVFEFGKGVNE